VALAAFSGTNCAPEQGHKDGVIFDSVQATPMFHKDKAKVRSEQFGRAVHDRYREFQAAGGRVMVCPVCMKAIDIGEGDLIAGAAVATVKSVNAHPRREESMKHGACNRIVAKVASIKKGDVMSLVKLDVQEPPKFSSLLTTESVKEPALVPGDTVEPVIEAIHVLPVKP
jgi:molybdate transport system regulatory protein